MKQEREGKGVRGEVDLSERITKACQEELEFHALIDTEKCSEGLYTEPMRTAVMEPASGTTLCATDSTLAPCDTARTTDEGVENGLKRKKKTAAELPILPPLRSPPLCPRRTFLAALILA